MSDAAEPTPSPTLGQRIDAVLQPLYDEAEQHRATLDEVKTQMAALKQKAEAARSGLAQIESRMATVVRSLAEQEPVIAAMVSPTGDPPSAPASTPSPASSEPPVAPEPEPKGQVQSEPVIAEPPADISAAAERAASVAQQLREKTGAN